MKHINYFLYSVLISFFWTGCNYPQNVTEHEIIIEQENYKVINSTFVHLALRSPEGVQRKFGYDNYEPSNFPIELKDSVYFNTLLVGFHDTLDFWSKMPDIKSIEMDGVNTEFYLLINRLLSDSSTTKSLNLDSITNTGVFELLPFKPDQIVKTKIGQSILTFSRIAYNNQFDKACFYFQDQCSGLCGYGSLILVEKNDGVWEIIGEINIWIA